MRKNSRIIFLLLILCAGIICSACVEQKTEAPDPGIGLVQVTMQPESFRISFETALQEFKKTIQPVSGNSVKIYYILGKDMDMQGNATSWFFGVRSAAGSRLLIFDKGGNTETTLDNSTLPTEEIILDSLVPPRKIFSEHQELLSMNPASLGSEIRDLELSGGIYTLSISSSKGVKIVRFNMKTGATVV